MKIKTLSGEVEIKDELYYPDDIWVRWTDIKPILDEYQSVIESGVQGVGDASVMIDK